jgi:preprotein translocase SecE subunit
MLGFFKNSIEELKKLQLPSKKEVYITTAIIAVVIFLTSIVILSADFLIAKIIGIIFGL